MIITITKSLTKDFPHITEQEVKDVINEIQREVILKEGERIPGHIILTPIMTPLPYGLYNSYQDSLEIFIPRPFLSKEYFTPEQFRGILKYIITHEVIEPIE